MLFHFAQKTFSSERVHTLSYGIYRLPNTSIEPLSQDEIIVIGGYSKNAGPWSQDADSIIIKTVSTRIFGNLGNLKVIFQNTNTVTELEIAETSVSSASRM